MKKSKYEKPVARNLDAVQPVQGSCLSGNVEYQLEPCRSGDQAIECATGAIVYPTTPCTAGAFAGGSCFTGTDAG